MQLFGVAAEAGGTHDQAHVVGHLQMVERFLDVLPILALDAARNTAGIRAVRHQHHVAAGETDERGQRSTFVAAFFLFDLDNDVLAFFQQLANASLVRAGAGSEVLLGDLLERQETVAVGTVIDKTRF